MGVRRGLFVGGGSRRGMGCSAVAGRLARWWTLRGRRAITLSLVQKGKILVPARAVVVPIGWALYTFVQLKL